MNRSFETLTLGVLDPSCLAAVNAGGVPILWPGVLVMGRPQPEPWVIFGPKPNPWVAVGPQPNPWVVTIPGPISVAGATR